MLINARANRRQVTKLLLSAAAGGLADAKRNAGAAISLDPAPAAKFELIRNRITNAIEQGEATGMAGAFVHPSS